MELADGPTIAGRRHPGRHDVSICRGCGEILILAETASGFVLRATTASEFLTLPDDAQALLRVAHALVRRQQRMFRTRPRQLN
jgi:hypothetical protein